MDIQNLIHMANRIGDFFQSFPDRTEAKAGIADHIHKFWEPRMRTALLHQLDSNSSAGHGAILSDIVREAVQEQRATLMPQTKN